eukprot:7139888-Alexandrium_andersonii.AAC.1
MVPARLPRLSRADGDVNLFAVACAPANPPRKGASDGRQLGLTPLPAPLVPAWPRPFVDHAVYGH